MWLNHVPLPIEMLLLIGGMRPKVDDPFISSSNTLLATWMGFLTPFKAPTAPNVKDCPSMILASHSTVPDLVRLEPIPAFVQGKS